MSGLVVGNTELYGSKLKRAKGFLKPNFERLPNYSRHDSTDEKIVTDKLRSYGVAHRELMPEVIHSTEQYENNRAEQSHEATRVRERVMRRFKSAGQAQRFLVAHAAVSNLFGRHLVRAQHYRDLRISALANGAGRLLEFGCQISQVRLS